MTPIQQMLLGVGAKKKTYIDDLFSTYLYKGNASARTITNGINLSGEGGLVWTKARNSTTAQNLIDTVRGNTKRIRSHSSGAETTINDSISAFNSNGYALAAETSGYGFNLNNINYSSWSFRKAPGFFDVVTWDGNDTAGRVISHSLGSVPGLIMIKSTTHTTAWFTFHRNLGAEKYLLLNETNTVADQTWFMNDTAPTSTGFSLGSSTNVNGSGRSYVAYVFAGGESTAATARSVDFDGSGDYLNSASSTDFAFGTGDFTIECWAKWNGGNTNFVSWSDDRTNCDINTDGSINYYDGTSHQSGAGMMPVGQWTHLAWVKSGTTVTVYKNGTSINSITSTYDAGSSARSFSLGGRYNGASPYNQLNGSISNFRIVKGTAVYTSSFKPPTEPLTNITNTKLLCCNNSSVTGTTVGTVTSVGDPTASTDSPFDDPAGFVFGENEDQNVIKCGSYLGNSVNDGPEIHVGWEPQWLFIKSADKTENWVMFDSMRGIHDGSSDEFLYPNDTGSSQSNNYIKLTPTGFKIVLATDAINFDGETHNYIWMAIRRPDGYCGKPAAAGTDVFAMDTGAGNGTMPNFDSGFPVDLALYRQPGASENWWTATRLTGTDHRRTNSDVGEGTNSANKWDSNVGWGEQSFDSGYQSWMWKRHAGFDVVTYKGDDAAFKDIRHSLGKTPEMIWIKKRDATAQWVVGHKGLNGGTNPWNYYLALDTTAAESAFSTAFNNTAPVSTHFTVGTDDDVNDTNSYMAFLFASVDGISKVGEFDGSDSEQTITTGFQPRLLILKASGPTNEYWYIFDTTRGWGSGNDATMWLNTNNAQWSTSNYGEPTSTGFTLPGNHAGTNDAGKKYIYYAHA